jgi:two-component system, NtrC family, response regulator HydG
MKNILIIDDDRDLCFLMKSYLNNNGFNCYEASNKAKAFEVLASNEIDLVLCDLNLKKEDGKDILVSIREEQPSLPVIIITGYSNVRTAVEVIRLGAIDYLLKPLIPAEVVFIINKRIAEILVNPPKNSVVSEALELPVPKPIEEGKYVFSPGKFFQDVLRQIDLVAPTDYSVIIYGESGSGKEAFAQEIHKRSKRKNKPFLAIDCCPRSYRRAFSSAMRKELLRVRLVKRKDHLSLPKEEQYFWMKSGIFPMIFRYHYFG